MSRTRSTQRDSFEQEVRIRLLEDDADDIEAFMANVKSTVDSAIKEIREDVGGVKKLLVGILVSVTTASILLVINVIVIGLR